jgi:hypothetical protein
MLQSVHDASVWKAKISNLFLFWVSGLDVVRFRGNTYEFECGHEDKACMVCGDVATLTYRLRFKDLPNRNVAEITLCDYCLGVLKKIDKIHRDRIRKSVSE